ICSGLGQYLNIDATILRLVFIILSLSNGIGILIYLILWVIIPGEGQDVYTISNINEFSVRTQEIRQEIRETFQRKRANTIKLIGISLVVLGVKALIMSFDLTFFQLLNDILWSVLLILGGIIIIIKSLKG
ncbi:MAG: PspC domain-containing protein, partial [Anaerolineaceae bacterium]|nr:PspC domain-containing protein [Anaerolineaceae bacterium]